MNILSMIPTDEWEAICVDPTCDHRHAESMQLTRKPLIGWAYTDDPHLPVAALTVHYLEDHYAAVADYDWNLVGYVHCSEGPEVLQRYREAGRENLHRRRHKAPPGSSLGKLHGLYPAPGWSAVFFDYHAGDSGRTMPPLVRKPLVGWGKYRSHCDKFVGLVVIDTAEMVGVGPGDLSLLAGYVPRYQPLETLEAQFKHQWEAHVWEETVHWAEW